MSKVVLLNPENENLWEDYVSNHQDSSVFHTLEWKKILENTFSNFDPYYFLSINENNVEGVLPSFLTNSLFGEEKLICTPNHNSTDILTDHDRALWNLIERFNNTAEELNTDYCLLKTGKNLASDTIEHFPFKKKVFYLEPLLFTPQPDMMSLYSTNFRSMLRRIKKKAKEYNLEVTRISHSDIHFNKLYNMMSKFIKKRHNFIPQTFPFFSNIINHLDRNHRLYVVKKDGVIIGCHIVLIYKKKAHIQWVFYDLEYMDLSPSHLLYDHICRTLGKEDYKKISFGFTPKDDEGGLFAKTRYTSDVKEVKFYYREFKKNSFPKKIPEQRFQTVRTILPYIPQPIFNLAVPWIHRLFR